MIVLEHLVKRFGDLTAVDDVSITIGDGEFFSLLGPSGCGKTTTLRMLGGFDAPDSGRILIEDEDVSGVPPNRRHVNMVFQNYALFPHMDVARNVAYGLKREGVKSDEIDRRVTDMLALVELPRDVFGQRRPKHLSGGQRQRVALARALIKRPTALLLDEPLGALDLKLRRGMQLELKGMQHELGITFVYVTHDQEEALTMSDRIAVMDGGRVVQIGTPREIYERPRTRFVAGFIGVSNIVELPVGRVSRGVATLDVAGGRVAVNTSDDVGERLSFCVRPEHLELSATDADPDQGGCELPGVVTGSAYLGSEVQYQVDADGVGSLTVVQSADSPGPSVGDPVILRWRPDNAVVLHD